MKNINLQSKGSYSIKAESATRMPWDRCQIFVNKGRNLCQNKRGHNIVVIDPDTDEYQSVSFDTWGHKQEVI